MNDYCSKCGAYFYGPEPHVCRAWTVVNRDGGEHTTVYVDDSSGCLVQQAKTAATRAFMKMALSSSLTYTLVAHLAAEPNREFYIKVRTCGKTVVVLGDILVVGD